jgi:hypothetical protein
LVFYEKTVQVWGVRIGPKINYSSAQSPAQAGEAIALKESKCLSGLTFHHIGVGVTIEARLNGDKPD